MARMVKSFTREYTFSSDGFIKWASCGTWKKDKIQTHKLTDTIHDYIYRPTTLMRLQIKIYNSGWSNIGIIDVHVYSHWTKTALKEENAEGREWISPKRKLKQRGSYDMKQFAHRK